MFTYIYTSKFYRFLKSGMLVDFFVKKYAYYAASFLFYINNIIFSEKFFVEYMVFRFVKFFELLLLYIDYYSTQFTYAVVCVAVFCLTGLFIFFTVSV